MIHKVFLKIYRYKQCEISNKVSFDLQMYAFCLFICYFPQHHCGRCKQGLLINGESGAPMWHQVGTHYKNYLFSCKSCQLVQKGFFVRDVDTLTTIFLCLICRVDVMIWRICAERWHNVGDTRVLRPAALPGGEGRLQEKSCFPAIFCR